MIHNTVLFVHFYFVNNSVHTLRRLALQQFVDFYQSQTETMQGTLYFCQLFDAVTDMLNWHQIMVICTIVTDVCLNLNVGPGPRHIWSNFGKLFIHQVVLFTWERYFHMLGGTLMT